MVLIISQSIHWMILKRPLWQEEQWTNLRGERRRTITVINLRLQHVSFPFAPNDGRHQLPASSVEDDHTFTSSLSLSLPISFIFPSKFYCPSWGQELGHRLIEELPFLLSCWYEDFLFSLNCCGEQFGQRMLFMDTNYELFSRSSCFFLSKGI